MKTFKFIAAFCILSGFPVFAQAAAHSVTLTWTAPADAVATSTYSIFRATGSCTGAAFGSALVTGVTATTYVDNTVVVGNYCYTAQQVQNGASSVNSNLAPVSVSPLPPVNVTVTAK